jgi:hypothetical protein
VDTDSGSEQALRQGLRRLLRGDDADAGAVGGDRSGGGGAWGMMKETNISSVAIGIAELTGAHRRCARAAGDVERGVPPKDATNRGAVVHAGLFGGRKAAAGRLPDWGGGEEFSANAREAGARLLAARLADGTRTAYAVGARKLAAFCYLGGIDLMMFLQWAPSQPAKATSAGAMLILSFLGWLSKCRSRDTGAALLTPGSVRQYGYGACNLIFETSWLAVTEHPVIRRVLARLKREDQAQRRLSAKKKLPLVPELGRQVALCALKWGTEAAIAFADVYMFTLFFGCRISELLVTGTYKDDPDRQLRLGGLVLFKRVKAAGGEEDTEVEVTEGEIGAPGLEKALSAVEIRLGHKTKGLRSRVRKVTRTSGDVLCPVLAGYRVRRRAKAAGRGPGSMAFSKQSGKPMRAGAAPPRSRARGPRTNGGPVTTADAARCVKPWEEDDDKEKDFNNDQCETCNEGGRLLCCSGCNLAYHCECLNPPLTTDQIPGGDWVCFKCFEEIVETKGAAPDAVPGEETVEVRDARAKAKGGSGYRGFLFKALDEGVEGDGCFWTTPSGRERVDPRRYSSHSGRSAFATMLFLAGASPLVIKDLGDWRSWCVLDYNQDDANRFAGLPDLLLSAQFVAPAAVFD